MTAVRAASPSPLGRAENGVKTETKRERESERERERQKPCCNGELIEYLIDSWMIRNCLPEQSLSRNHKVVDTCQPCQ